MAFEIKDPPEFTLDIEQWNKKTKANGEKMALVIEKLLNNDVFTKALIEYLDGNALLEGDKGIPGGVASLGHLPMIFDAKWQNFCVRKIPMPMPVQAQGS